jgi:hypothetical protein
MAAPERFAKRQIPLAPRAPSMHGPERPRRLSAFESVVRGLSAGLDRWSFAEVDTSDLDIRTPRAALTTNA